MDPKMLYTINNTSVLAWRKISPIWDLYENLIKMVTGRQTEWQTECWPKWQTMVKQYIHLSILILFHPFTNKEDKIHTSPKVGFKPCYRWRLWQYSNSHLLIKHIHCFLGHLAFLFSNIAENINRNWWMYILLYI